MTLNGYDDLTVCNWACSHVGWRPINSITEPVTDKEFALAAHYPAAFDLIMAKHDWKCANPVEELAADADAAPLGGYIYAYKLPSGSIAGPFAVYTAADLNRPIDDYINANDYIHTSENSCFVKYRGRPAVGIVPPFILDLVAYETAIRIAKSPQCNKPELATELRIALYGDARLNGEGGLYKDAKRIDAHSAPLKTMFRNGDPLTRLVY